MGTYRRKTSAQEKKAPVGAMAGATLGLLAFLLAFTFGLAASRFDAKRQVVLDEANAIGTTYLRAGMLPEHRDEVRAGSIVVGLFTQSLNEVIDLHAKRLLVSIRSRIPGVIWVGLYAVATLSRSPEILAIARAFSVVIWLISDLDRPGEGLLKVSQQAMVDLQQSMAEPKR